MNKGYSMTRLMQFIFACVLLLLPVNFLASTSPQSAPNIAVSGQFTSGSVRRGSSVKASLVMDIPSGFHVNSSKPLEKFLVATQLQIEAPKGIKVGPVSYPRPVLRNFKFSKSKVSVYEGRATMRFSVMVPASYSSNSAELKARLRFQSCNEELCFPPQTKDVNLSLAIN
jgi:DsbC/DsbD-like thiol-disulfide interchange protein